MTFARSDTDPAADTVDRDAAAAGDGGDDEARSPAGEVGGTDAGPAVEPVPAETGSPPAAVAPDPLPSEDGERPPPNAVRPDAPSAPASA
ncbi:MAG TPA: hypothetical protein VGC90_01460, partial [Candidatus Limnocylindrales bacterium]